MSRAQDFPYLSAPFTALAHRGGAEWEPNRGKENTLHAFRSAVALGYQYIETDVQATHDGELVCFHDDTLDRLAEVAGRVCDYTASELREFRIAGSEPIPFFDAVVETFPTTRFNVDMKSDQAVEPLLKLIRDHHLADRILVDSFSQSRLKRFRKASQGRIATAMGPLEVAWTALVPGLSTTFGVTGPVAQVPIRYPIGPLQVPVLTEATIARVHKLGKVVHVWTIDDPAEMNRLIDLGVDGIVTDRPDLLKEVLIERQLWADS